MKSPSMKSWPRSAKAPSEKCSRWGQSRIEASISNFSTLFQARDKKNKAKIVALKKVLMDNEKVNNYCLPFFHLKMCSFLGRISHHGVEGDPDSAVVASQEHRQLDRNLQNQSHTLQQTQIHILLGNNCLLKVLTLFLYKFVLGVWLLWARFGRFALQFQCEVLSGGNQDGDATNVWRLKNLIN